MTFSPDVIKKCANSEVLGMFIIAQMSGVASKLTHRGQVVYIWVFTRGYGWLTHWGRVTHICVSRLTITDSDNGLSPGRRQAIIWTNVGILLIGPLGKNLNEILIEILTFSFKKMRLKVSSAKRRPFCLGPNVLTYWHVACSVPSSY